MKKMTDIVERLQYWAFKFCGKGEREDIASDAMTDGWQEIERLRKRVELLEGYLNGALNVIEGFVHCDTTEARKALGEKE